MKVCLLLARFVLALVLAYAGIAGSVHHRLAGHNGGQGSRHSVGVSISDNGPDYTITPTRLPGGGSSFSEYVPQVHPNTSTGHLRLRENIREGRLESAFGRYISCARRIAPGLSRRDIIFPFHHFS